MKKPHTFKLVDGKFSPADARKILMELIQSKIDHHSRELYAKQERNDSNLAGTEKRITQLRKSADILKKVLATAEKKGQLVKVKGAIEIEFLD